MVKENDCWPTTIFITVGQQFFFSLKAEGNKLVNFKLVLYLTLLSNLEKQ